MYYDKRKRLWRITLPKGSKPRTVSFEAESEAIKFEARLKLGIADTTPSERRTVTFADLSARWVREYAKAERSETLWKKDERRIALHILPSFGNVPASELKMGHLMALKAELQEKQAPGKRHLLSKQTTNHVLTLAKGIMSWALARDLIAKDTFRPVKKLKIPEGDYDWWTVDELDAYLERGRERGVDPELMLIVETAMMSGLRRGELAALTGRRLEFGRRRVTVAESFSFDIGKTVSAKGKTIEEVPMNSRLLSALEPKRFVRRDDLVFRRDLFPEIRRRFKDSCLVAGVRPIKFHELRHSFGSNLAAAGVPVKVIQKLMRHKSLAMTMRYMHLAPGGLDGSTEVLCGGPVQTKVIAGLADHRTNVDVEMDALHSALVRGLIEGTLTPATHRKGDSPKNRVSSTP